MPTDWMIEICPEDRCCVCGRPTQVADMVLCETYKVKAGAIAVSRVWCRECSPEPEPPLSALVGVSADEMDRVGWTNIWSTIGWEIGRCLQPTQECPGKQNIVNSKAAMLHQLKRWVRHLEDELG